MTVILNDLSKVKCVMLDLDGTIYLGNSVFPYTADFLNQLEKHNIKHLFLTNNSSKSAEAYVKKFAKMGIKATKDDILISSHAAADYINTKYKNKRAFLLGTDAFKEEMKQLGVNVCDENPEILLAGFDTGLEYDNLTRFANLVNTGLPYIATHPDAVCPCEEGFLPDLGSVIELIYSCTKRRPEVICGKPNEQILIAAEHKTGFSRENLLMVGDRLMTDIAIGKHGVPTALVLSGEATAEDVKSAKIKPTYIFSDIKELGEEIVKQL